MTDAPSHSSSLKTPPLPLAHLQVAQAQMAMGQYDFGALVRVTKHGFVNHGDSVMAETEFQNENGEFEDGPRAASTWISSPAPTK